MKRFVAAAVTALLILSGCTRAVTPTASSAVSPLGQKQLTVNDSTGTQVTAPRFPETVVALSASLAELWLEAGGKIVGTTSDTFEKDRLDLSRISSPALEKVQNVGTIKDPSGELILALKPDLVILSPSISGHKSVAKVLQEANIPCYFADADSFSDYLEVYKDFTDLTGRDDLYSKLGEGQKKAIQGLIERQPGEKTPSVLALRAYTSGFEAKSKGTVLTNMLSDLAINNIAGKDVALTETFSLEKVVQDNPDCILIVYMGSEKAKTDQYLQQNLYSNPVWSTLDAVKSKRVFLLAQDLFHFKPNGRWEEAYGVPYKNTLREIKQRFSFHAWRHFH